MHTGVHTPLANVTELTPHISEEVRAGIQGTIDFSPLIIRTHLCAKTRQYCFCHFKKLIKTFFFFRSLLGKATHGACWSYFKHGHSWREIDPSRNPCPVNFSVVLPAPSPHPAGQCCSQGSPKCSTTRQPPQSLPANPSYAQEINSSIYSQAHPIPGPESFRRLQPAQPAQCHGGQPLIPKRALFSPLRLSATLHCLFPPEEGLQKVREPVTKVAVPLGISGPAPMPESREYC